MIRFISRDLFSSTILSVILITFFPLYSHSSDGEMERVLWQKLSAGDHFAMIRHALAPGVGDPVTFALQDCSTQRNLSDKGRQQSRDIGNLFRDNGIGSADVYSSQWCRCLETARLLELGEVKELPIINSFFQNFEDEGPQTKALVQWLDRQSFTKPLVLISHQVNITAFTGVYPSSGEIVIVKKDKNGSYSTVGTIETD